MSKPRMATLHFDVIADNKENNKTIQYAKEWLRSIDEKDPKVSLEECRFCHSQSIPEEIEIEIMIIGFFIFKMEGRPQ